MPGLKYSPLKLLLVKKRHFGFVREETNTLVEAHVKLSSCACARFSVPKEICLLAEAPSSGPLDPGMRQSEP